MQADHTTLGKNVIPIRYKLEFEPNLKKFTFKCDETIEVMVKNKTSQIVLNASELKVNEVHIQSGHMEHRVRANLNAKKELLILRLGKAISGDAKIRIKFIGINNDKLHGFYRSKYTDGNKEKYLLTTQLEPADARKCFPCFDEPEFKALFNVSFVVDKSLDCISNTPIKKVERLSNNRKRVIFQETLKMPPYLIYLGIGNFEYTRGKIGKIDEAVVVTKGKKSLSLLPLKYGKEFVNFYEKYFGIDYPLPKLDLLAIPDFSAGAMENWGAITSEKRLCSLTREFFIGLEATDGRSGSPRA